MYRGHIIGTVILRLRTMRLSGERLPELLRFMKRAHPGDAFNHFGYLAVAFRANKALALGMASENDPVHRDNLLERIEHLIDGAMPTWSTERFPALAHIRDYFSFLQFAKDQNIVVTVCGTTQPGDQSEKRHNTGDSDVPICRQPYRLHGAFDADTHEPAWTGSRGEHLRTTINRLLGEELVSFGPHDQWKHRNDHLIAGPLWGPQVPVIEFHANQQIRNILTVEELAQSFQYTGRWSTLYPHHPVASGQ